MSDQHEVVLSNGTRITRFPVGFAYGQVFLSFAARTESDDFGEDGFSSLAHVRLEQGGRVISSSGGGGGGSARNWSDHLEYDWTDFDGPTFDVVYHDESCEIDRESLRLPPDGEWRAYPTRRVSVRCDHGAEWPVWDRRGLTTPGDFPELSPELVAGLRSWGRVFVESFDHRSGWPGDFDVAAYFREGRALADRLQGELGEDVDVRFHD